MAIKRVLSDSEDDLLTFFSSLVLATRRNNSQGILGTYLKILLSDSVVTQRLRMSCGADHWGSGRETGAAVKTNDGLLRGVSE